MNVCKMKIQNIIDTQKKNKKKINMTKGKIDNTKHKWFNINEYMYLVQFSSFNTHTRDNGICDTQHTSIFTSKV